MEEQTAFVFTQICEALITSFSYFKLFPNSDFITNNDVSEADSISFVRHGKHLI
jgi:hypothetical protein